MSRIANRQLTKLREPNRFADLAQVLAAILLLIIPAFYYASQRATNQRAELEIASLERRLADLAERRLLLQIQLASELDPRRLHDRARQIAGLSEATAEQIRYLARPGMRGLEPVQAAPLAGEPDGHP